ncbi:MAG: ABC transporter permease [Planctomycetales bacterium]|nr:ABC transporter permease [bacterium]UNM07198.1 MAG: ABC transporter permease [Planctomycetales bacterium]
MKLRWEYITAVGGLLVMWWLLYLWLGEQIIAEPRATFTLLWEELGEQKFRAHITASLWRILAGMLVALAAAVPLGLAAGSSPRLDRWLKPVLYLTYPLPKIVFLPLLLMLMGIGNGSKIALIAIILFFHLLATTRDAARAVPPSAVTSLRSLGGGPWQLFVHVYWPATLPALFTSLRIATGTVVAVLFFVETIATTKGIGAYIYNAWSQTNITGMAVGIIVLSLIGILLYELFDLLERRLCRWTGYR